jgi:hypothetical protein
LLEKLGGVPYKVFANLFYVFSRGDSDLGEKLDRVRDLLVTSLG